jgi:hypothetical protein
MFYDYIKQSLVVKNNTKKEELLEIIIFIV